MSSAGLRTSLKEGCPEERPVCLTTPPRPLRRSSSEVSSPLSQPTYASPDIRRFHLREWAGSGNDVKRRAGQERPETLGNASFPAEGIFPRCRDTQFGLTPVFRPLSRNARLSQSLVHCQEIRYYLQEEGGGGGHSYTCCPNLALKQKPLEIINPRPGKKEPAFRMNFSSLASLPHSEIRLALPLPQLYKRFKKTVKIPGPLESIRIQGFERIPEKGPQLN